LTDPAPQTPIRIQTLDVLRGLAVLGILAVNIPAFSLPLMAELMPGQVSFATAPGAGTAQWFTDVFFMQKFVTLFSMLFGISLFLVGGEKDDPVRSPLLKRRLGWLALFGLLHGLVFWYGDILLLYAWTGFLMSLMRSWPAKRLILIGAGITFVLGFGQAISALMSSEPADLSDIFSSQAVANSLAAYQSGFPGYFIENLKAWGITQGFSLFVYTVPTLGLMMLGLGLFKAGFFHARLPLKLYWGLIAAGAVTLTVLGALQGIEKAAGPDMNATRGWAMAVLSFPALITLGYASALILLTSRLPLIRKVLAPVGQMAVTNYLTQTLIMTTIFYLPWGPRLIGQVDYAQMWAFVGAVWLLQLIWSPIWLKHFRMGPFEWVWRCLTNRQRLPLRRV